MKQLIIFLLIISSHSPLNTVAIPVKQANGIGKKIWHNECGGTIEGLTSWNEGEEFASVGIGHFIWCARGKPCPFSETFPTLLSFINKSGKKVPSWLKSRSDCPWKTRQDFLKNINSARMVELRKFLCNTIDLQVAFILNRFELSLPRILDAVPPKKRSHIVTQLKRLEKSERGVYALVDYINFKGEGIRTTERYKGQGWGLLDVLQRMKGTAKETAVNEFAHSAKIVLTNRIQNAPKSRNEGRWLPGWKNRIDTYTQ